ncbi:MAG TPA: hypothetical protein VE982_04530 [Gaiellaceae bacterium]|nr:hypothetical protein [Gaiellaceae bacterium]
MKAVLLALVLFFACTARALAGGPYMMVGAAEDVAVSDDPTYSKQEMLEAKLVGFDTIRITQTWTRGQTALGPTERLDVTNAVAAAEFAGIRVILSLYPFGSSVTPLSDQDRADFVAFCVDAVKQFPYVHDFIIGNEPNLNRFWMPQFGPSGEDVAAPAYEQLLAQAYDAIKAVRPHSTVYGGALAPRGVDKPNTGRDTHSPTAFIADLGAAYKASGRQVPIMDAFAFHPYPENSQTGPNFPHPNSSSIGLADYAKLVSLLGSAFDGTAQRGSSIPILYDEFGIETVIPPAKASLYTGTEPATTKPVDEATQAQMYTQAMQMAFCQPTVMGLLLFHVQDETALPAWQSGVFYADGSPKSSLPAVTSAVASVHRGVITTCPTLQLTPKLVLKAAKPSKTGTVKVTLTCSLDCRYTLQLDSRRVTGTAVGRVPKIVVFRGKLRSGRHVVAATARAVANAGPPATARTSFTSR